MTRGRYDGLGADEMLALGQAVLKSQPFSRLLGAEMIEFTLERTAIAIDLREELLQQHGFAHGGLVSYLADNALTFAGGAQLSGQIVTAEMKINYIRPAVGQRLIVRAHALSAGRTQAVARCEVYAIKDGKETLCAAAQGTISSIPARDS